MSYPVPGVYLVIDERSGLFGAYLNLTRAHEVAEAIGGVVAGAPIVADYRPHFTIKTSHPASSSANQERP